MFLMAMALGLCGGGAAVLAVQALVQHKRFADAARMDMAALRDEVRKMAADAVAEIRRLTGKP
ncbi:MAG: hypothetical protein HKL95_05850 [Phycisphaerae bacterium]|nr:hypothetical protein [Phycisphaerae bacterium]